MKIKYYGYVTTPFGEKNGINFDEFFHQQIFPAPTVAIGEANVLLFREDSAIQPPWKKSQKHVEKVEKYIGPYAPSETQLRQSIQENIIASDFVVAVLTNQNPNVMLEIGFAQALQKVIIYLIKKEQFDKLPSNLGNLKRLHLYTENEDVKYNLCNRIQEAISVIDGKEKYDIEHGGDELKYFKSRQSIHLWRIFENAKKRIRILTTNLTTVNANLIDSVVKAVQNTPSLEVKILTSDPENDFIGPRARQLGEDEMGYRMELQGSLQSIHAKFQKYQNCEIRTYKDFPVQLWHLVDDYLYIGQSSLVRRTRHNCVFGISVITSGVKETYLDHFDTLWEKSSIPTKKAMC